ncbi:hypothetical protein N3553_24280 [Pantoea dispersa]|uniref:hypothetical protein n=1 Tax=Pantoea dispersa TaxID=59814 RepID=UPI0021AF2B96|nr:hypothetical protein [Pantoea dispersa]MCT6592980.1 hypothetical protein [Pantoea dispersa]
MINLMSVKFCTLLNGCGDLTQRLPTFPGILLVAVTGVFMVCLLRALYGWRTVIFSTALVGLTDLLLYVRLEAARWPQGDAAMATLFSGFIIISTLAFEGRSVGIFPHLRYALRLITPVLSVGITLVLWLQHGVRG